MREATPLLIEVRSNLDQSLSLESLAWQYGYSPYHFHRFFSRAVGETPNNTWSGCGSSAGRTIWRSRTNRPGDRAVRRLQEPLNVHACIPAGLWLLAQGLTAISISLGNRCKRLCLGGPVPAHQAQNDSDC